MITTSEVGVSITIDNTKHLDEIVNELKKFGTVSIDKDMVIICVAGDMDSENVGFQAKVVNALAEVPVRMISYGGSNYNVSFVVKAGDKVRALQALSSHLFNYSNEHTFPPSRLGTTPDAVLLLRHGTAAADACPGQGRNGTLRL